MSTKELTVLTKSTRGPKLKPDQVRVIQETIVTYWEVPTVQAVLREEHPTIPAVTDTMIRTYRRDIDQALTSAETDAIRQRILTTGLALKETRVAHLKNLWQRCAQALDAKHQLTDRQGNRLYNEAGDPIVEVELRADLVREMREIMVQIAREVGQPLAALAQLVVMNTTNNVVVPEVHQIMDQMRRIIEQEQAEERASEGLAPWPPLDS